MSRCENWNTKENVCKLRADGICNWEAEAPCYKEAEPTIPKAKTLYVVVGELEDTNQIDKFECAYTSLRRADERCTELESHPDNCHIWCLREVTVVEGD